MLMQRRQRIQRLVRLLVAARAVNQLGAFSLAFLTVLLCRALGASIAAAGLVTAAFGLATIPSRLLGGWLAGRLGRRRTILTGLVGCAVAQLGIATAHDLAVAAAFAVLLGLAFELYEPPSQAMIADVTAPDERAAAYGLLTMALSVGNMGAGLVAAAVGSENLRWLFVVDAASCLGCALIVYLAVPADSPPPKGDRRIQVRGSSPWRDPALLAMTASGTVFALIYMGILVALPLSLAGARHAGDRVVQARHAVGGRFCAVPGGGRRPAVPAARRLRTSYERMKTAWTAIVLSTPAMPMKFHVRPKSARLTRSSPSSCTSSSATDTFASRAAGRVRPRMVRLPVTRTPASVALTPSAAKVMSG